MLGEAIMSLLLEILKEFHTTVRIRWRVSQQLRKLAHTTGPGLVEMFLPITYSFVHRRYNYSITCRQCEYSNLPMIEKLTFLLDVPRYAVQPCPLDSLQRG